MTTKPTRVVDAHVHLWDPARSDWYPYLSGDPSRMNRRFDVETYSQEAGGWNVEKIVNVAAATGPHSVDETLALEELAEAAGQPAGIVGGVPAAESIEEAIAFLDRQMTASRFRGVRPMGAGIGTLPSAEVLAALQDRGLVFDLMAQPDKLAAAAEQLAPFDRLTIVVEHTGWPRDDSAEERALWADGLRALASLGDNVVCKLSGLAMPLRSMSPDALRPWLEPAIETFGVDRCMFASNFPVDSLHGTFDELYTTLRHRDRRSRRRLPGQALRDERGTGVPPLAAVGAGPQEVEAVRLGPEARRAGHVVHEVDEAAFEPRRRREVLDRAAGHADQVMVMTDELFGELEASELVGSSDAVDDAGLLEDRQIPIGGALGQIRAAGDQLGCRHRPLGADDGLDHAPPPRRITLPDPAQTTGDCGVQVLLHSDTLSQTCNENGSRSRFQTCRGSSSP